MVESEASVSPWMVALSKARGGGWEDEIFLQSKEAVR
jgi:hypothetical protein